MRGFVFACLVLASAAHIIPYGSSSSSPATHPTPSTSTAQPPALDQPTSTSPAYESSTTAAPYGTLSTTPAADEPSTPPSSPPTTLSYAMSSSSSESSTPAEDEPSSTSPATSTSTSSYDSYGSSSVPTLPQDEPSTSTTFLPTTSTSATSLPPTSTSNYNSDYEEYNSGAVAEMRSLDSPTAESSGQFPWNDGGDVCQGRADGLYEWRVCSAQFEMCLSGRLVSLSCGIDFVFTSAGRCESLSAVPECEALSTTTPALDEPSATTSPVPSSSYAATY